MCASMCICINVQSVIQLVRNLVHDCLRICLSEKGKSQDGFFSPAERAYHYGNASERNPVQTGANVLNKAFFLRDIRQRLCFSEALLSMQDPQNRRCCWGQTPEGTQERRTRLPRSRVTVTDGYGRRRLSPSMSWSKTKPGTGLHWTVSHSNMQASI